MAKYILVFMSLLLTTTSVSGANVDKFDWGASESAPDGTVMQVVSGRLVYTEGGSLYVPDGVILHHGWGNGRSSHVVGPDLKPLPNKLVISFFSYLENQFYEGEFELPYDRILALFNAGYYSPKEKKKITYNKIVAGVAPGGAVSVWLTGIDKKQEVFFGMAEKVDSDFKIIIDNPEYPRDLYVKLNIEETLTPEEIDNYNKDGIPFGLWEKYHKRRYHWQPVFTGFEIRNGLIDLINYYNGEESYIYVPLDEQQAKETRAVPKEISFVWKSSDNKNLMYELYFDEVEVFELFEKLGKGNKPLTLELKMLDTEKGKQFGVLLKNDKEGIYFRKLSVKKYGA